jgi:CheY-like chemotaxis protein
VRRKRARPAADDETALAMFAHEIRTTLTGILALGELLSTSELGSREREWASAVKGTAEHLSDLTTLVVESAKAKAKRLALRRDAFDVRLFVEAIATGLSARAAAKGLAANVKVADDLPARVRGDAARLRGALENLIDNALKFTDHGSVGLDVAVKTMPRQHVRLSFVVSDTGVGLDRAAVKRLFRPYAQASADVARLYGGAGLGLVSVKRIAKAMRGNLTVDSAPDAGARFRLDIVVPAVSAATLPPTVRKSEASAGTRRLHVLCVEDNPFGRVILDTVLSELGHRATFAATGEAAVAAVTRQSFDAVLMDVTLPTLDGLEAARRIRALPGAAATVPIIGTSGRASADDESKALAAGMNFYLRKPVSPAALAVALARAMFANGDQAER